MHIVYDYLALPKAAFLGKRVYKKMFFDHADLTAADRRTFTDDINTVTWQYTLKPATLNVNAYRDDERDYGELAIVEVILKDPKRATRIAEQVHRAIPYPLVLLLVQDDTFAISTAHKRASQSEAGAVVAEDLRLTRWMGSTQLADIERDFLESLALSGLPQTDYYALYASWHHRLLALACARLTMRYSIAREPDQQSRQRDRLAACHQLEHEIARLRAEIKQESRFNRQVDLNTRIKALENDFQQAVAEL